MSRRQLLRGAGAALASACAASLPGGCGGAARPDDAAAPGDGGDSGGLDARATTPIDARGLDADATDVPAEDSDVAPPDAAPPDDAASCPRGLRTVAEWEAIFVGIWERKHAGEYLGLSTSNDSWRYYNLAYAIDALAAIWQATGNERYLARAMLYIENVIADATASPSAEFDDAYLGWISRGNGTEGQEIPLYESYCWRYVTRLLRLMRARGLDAHATWGPRFRAVLAFTERNIWDKWFRRGLDAYLYRSHTHMAAHWAYIATNVGGLTADATRRGQCQTVSEAISWRGMPPYRGASIRGQMRDHPTLGAAGYFWNWQWNQSARPGSDVSHGGNTLAFIVEAIEKGEHWTTADAARFVATLDRAIWRTSTDAAAFVDGSGSEPGWFNEGWVKLGRFSAALQRRLEGHTVGRNIQLYANGALNAYFLCGGR